LTAIGHSPHLDRPQGLIVVDTSLALDPARNARIADIQLPLTLTRTASISSIPTSSHVVASAPAFCLLQ
jgi:hypothetical protein